MKIAVASIMQETCSFSTVHTTLQDFKDGLFKLGPDVVKVKPKEWVIGGFVAGVKPRKFRLEGIVSTTAMAGGEVTVAAFAKLKTLLLSGLRRKGPFDAVFLADHGAMAVVGEPDPEGLLLSEVRKLVGKKCFIGVSLDHHANITQKAVDAADVILGYDTQPHDLPAAGAKAARVILDIWDRKRTPHAALVKVPMVTPQDQFLTSAGPMKEWFDLAREIERDDSVMVASNFPTQPWLDVPDNGWGCLVYADTEKKARDYARKLGRKVWGLRAQFWRSERLSVPKTVAAANAAPRGLVVISDTGDTVYGGAPGDSMSILAEMLKSGVNGPALIPVVDPESLRKAFKAGVGKEIVLRLGGKMSSAYSKSIELKGTIRALTKPGERDFSDGRKVKCGRTALFEHGHLKIAILELRDRIINHPTLYEGLGINVRKAKMVVLKTASNFQYFAKYRSRLIRADSQGASQSDLTAFDWKHITRPIYPFDKIKGWKP